MKVCLVMEESGFCSKTGDVPSITSTDQAAVTISASVGLKGANAPADVRKIQDALNRIPASRGGAQPPLAVSGVSDERTWKAIHAFQLKHFGWSGADGRVDPGRQTIERINQLLFSNPPMDPAKDSGLVDAMLAHLGRVRRGVQAAQASLLSALAAVDALGAPMSPIGPSPEERVDRAFRHFGIGRLPKERRRDALSKALQVYNVISAALFMPGALGSNAFALDPTGDPRIAFAYTGGFFLQGATDERNGLPMDKIHFGKRSFFALDNPDLCAHVITHEAAHFVGFPGGDDIGDPGRGWYGDAPMSGLSPDQLLRAADSYANFAHESRTGVATRPAWVKAGKTSR